MRKWDRGVCHEPRPLVLPYVVKGRQCSGVIEMVVLSFDRFLQFVSEGPLSNKQFDGGIRHKP